MLLVPYIHYLFPRLVTRSFEIVGYIWIYNNYNLLDLPWDSSVTWLAAMLMMDFLFYWFHRFCHGESVSGSVSPYTPVLILNA